MYTFSLWINQVTFYSVRRVPKSENILKSYISTSKVALNPCSEKYSL